MKIKEEGVNQSIKTAVTTNAVTFFLVFTYVISNSEAFKNRFQIQNVYTCRIVESLKMHVHIWAKF